MIGAMGGCATAPKSAPPPTPAVRLPHVQPPAGPANGLRIGLTASTKFSQYALYLKHVVDAVQEEWTGLVLKSSPRPASGTYVVVQFHLDAHGNIAVIDKVDNVSSDLGQRLCLSALTNPAPFGDWTPDMKAALNPAGEELTMTFWYQ